MTNDLGILFEEAINALKSKDYPLALEKYESFFDNSRSPDCGYGGVRLSYCLDDWVSLGTVYSPALDALKRKKNECLTEFNINFSWDMFHDYSAICDYLKCSEEPVELFLELNIKNKGVAKSIFPIVHEKLAKRSEWELCREYLGSGYREYKLILKTFDLDTKLAKKLEPEDRKEHLDYSETKTIEKILLLLEMLYRTDSIDELDIASERIEADFSERNRQDIYEKIIGKCT